MYRSSFSHAQIPNAFKTWNIFPITNKGPFKRARDTKMGEQSTNSLSNAFHQCIHFCDHDLLLPPWQMLSDDRHREKQIGPHGENPATIRSVNVKPTPVGCLAWIADTRSLAVYRTFIVSHSLVVMRHVLRCESEDRSLWYSKQHTREQKEQQNPHQIRENINIDIVLDSPGRHDALHMWTWWLIFREFYRGTLRCILLPVSTANDSGSAVKELR